MRLRCRGLGVARFAASRSGRGDRRSRAGGNRRFWVERSSLLLGIEKMGCAQIDNSVLPAAMGWESTLVHYRLINEEVRRRLGGLHSADCLIRSLDFAEVERLEREDRWPELAEHLAVEACALEASGAELLVICTQHRPSRRREDRERDHDSIPPHCRRGRRRSARRRPPDRRPARHELHDGPRLLRGAAA